MSFRGPSAIGLACACVTTVVAMVACGGAATPALAIATPRVEVQEVNNATAVSAHVRATVDPHGVETRWRFEFADKEEFAKGNWRLAQEGVISQTEAEAVQSEVQKPEVSTVLSGLKGDTVYYVRLAGTSEPQFSGGPGEKLSQPVEFETEGAPDVLTFEVHALHGAAMRALGAVKPKGTLTTEEQIITINGATGGTFTLTVEDPATKTLHTTEPIPFIPHETEFQRYEHDRIERALNIALGSESEHVALVTGTGAGPYTVRFLGRLAGENVSQMTADGSRLEPSSATIMVTTSQDGGGGYETHYWAESVDDEEFQHEGWKKAKKFPPLKNEELGFGAGGEAVVGIDMPGMQTGEGYHYRFVAKNDSPGDPEVDGQERTLSMPPPVQASSPECPNAQYRTGLSARLPDCRAYEQVTPVEKEGAMEAFHYGLQLQNEGALVGEDGEHVAFNGLFVQWGSTGQSPYFFSRDESGNWLMAAGTPQPEASVDEYVPEIYSADLDGFAFSAVWHAGLSERPPVRFMTGRAGGPYATLASVPIGKVGENGGWSAATEDLSRLILTVEDHTLCGGATGTTQGYDLYEYFEGRCRQVNVGAGSCGAHVVKIGAKNARGAISADGSRVFFEAVPGNVCSEASHLYMRVEGKKTEDLGAYRFVNADKQDAKLLLESSDREFFLYDVGSGTIKPLFSGHGQEVQARTSEDLKVIYFELASSIVDGAPSRGGIYSYDLDSGSLRFVIPGVAMFEKQDSRGGVDSISPDGRYVFFHGVVPGLPAGALDPQRVELKETGAGGDPHAEEAFRYDRVENVVECISCASAFDPEPRYDAFFEEGSVAGARSQTANGVPRETVAASDGSFAFFDTVAALVPQDIDGEITPESRAATEPLYASNQYSPSSDVYEWRAPGVYGCDRLEGCISLISSGEEGKLVMLLGASPSGRDMFFSTAAPLSALDGDSSSDIYDARIGGRAAVPIRAPLECEGDTCSTAAAAPQDLAPSSFTFHGPDPMQHPDKRTHTRHKVRHKHKHKRRPRARHAWVHHGGGAA